MHENSQVSVSLVNLEPFITGNDSASRKQAAHDLAKELKFHGVAAICGLRLNPDLLDDAYKTSEKLFNLPIEDKMKAPHPDAMFPHRGYSGIGREHSGMKSAADAKDEATKAAYLKLKDYKETYEVGSDENVVNHNIWLPDDVLPGFRPFATELFWTLNKVVNVVFEAFILGLDLTDEEAEVIRQRYTGHYNQLRFLHFPPISEKMLEDENLVRMCDHTDSSTLTLLFPKTSSSWEYLNRKSDTYTSVTPVNGVAYLSLGEFGKRISNGLYPDGRHRVATSGRKSKVATPEEYLMQLYVCASPESVIDPPDSLVTAQGKQVYEPSSWMTYLEGLIKALS